MNEANMAAKQPAVMTLEAGTYYWCACSRSGNQPFCDGSHQGTGFEPVAFEIAPADKVALCQCRRAGTPPYSDGTHNTLQDRRDYQQSTGGGVILRHFFYTQSRVTGIA